MKEDQYRSQFRLPYSLYEKLKGAADEHGESLNKELVTRLERSFATQDMGFKADGLDIAGYLAMTLMIALSPETPAEEKQILLTKAREIARPLIEEMVFNGPGATSITSCQGEKNGS